MHAYLVITTGNKLVLREVVLAETYWDAVKNVAPGNDLMKIEVIELGIASELHHLLSEPKDKA